MAYRQPDQMWYEVYNRSIEVDYIADTYFLDGLFYRQADAVELEEDRPNTAWLGTGYGSGILGKPPLAYHGDWLAEERVAWTATAFIVLGTGLVDDSSWRTGTYEPPPAPPAGTFRMTGPAVMVVKGDGGAFSGGDVHFEGATATIDVSAGDGDMLSGAIILVQDDPAIVEFEGPGGYYIEYDEGSVVPTAIPSGSSVPASRVIRVFSASLSPTVDSTTQPVIYLFYPTDVVPVTDGVLVPDQVIAELDCWAELEYAIVPEPPGLPPYEPPPELPPDDTPVDPGPTNAPSGLHIKALRTLGIKMTPPAGYSNGNPHS